MNGNPTTRGGAVVKLDEHRYRLGGSTIGAAVGVNPYVSPIRLWLDMTRGRADEDTEAMRLGRRLEPVIFAELAHQGYEVERTPDAEVRDPARPWLVGHPDGFGAHDGVQYVVDAKASARGYDSPPPHYLAQVQTYMHLCGLDEALIATLAGLHVTIVDVRREQHAVDTMLGLAEDFLEHVRNGVQPAPMGHPDDRAALLLAHPSAMQGQRVRETREIREARRDLVALLAAEKARKARVERLRAVVTDYMGDAEVLIDSHDNVVATWKNAPSNRLDVDRLKAERPDVYAEFLVTGQTRRFIPK